MGSFSLVSHKAIQTFALDCASAFINPEHRMFPLPSRPFRKSQRETKDKSRNA